MIDMNKEREAFAQTEFNTFGLDVKDFKTTGEYFMFIGWLLRSEQEKAKAQAVPDTHILIPKEPNHKTIMAMACVCLGAVGSDPEFLTLKDAKDVYSALVEKESGAER
ncbi:MULTISPECIES: hypothetical protein [Acinetobacter calcoaceticus/baumannii complex]|uniref:hypothetical protein n=1 Tax=Acinetobacter calcoaceticus/baumannii complex TaxID=909768 RepID=UPI0002818DEE|nr:hypothetical protein [Acinetobacter baumannii]EIB6855954.1 hypothetical protein [Acinetobacter baumannii]EKB38765.1 hypothetical protein W9G_01779 [Acinetobacter baumannii Ab11111]EKV3929981.1 hypothetical protein [Acinetobacter baumannii]EKX0521453.1 hypothetical protein [Acinetobacter baumannii]EKX0524549.1 hypothetical protein [Acinetobacter baumannii]